MKLFQVGVGLIGGLLLVAAFLEKNLTAVMWVVTPTLLLVLFLVYVQDLLAAARDTQRDLFFLAHYLVLNFSVIAGGIPESRKDSGDPGEERRRIVANQLEELEVALRTKLGMMPRPAIWFLSMIRMLPGTGQMGLLLEDLGVVVNRDGWNSKRSGERVRCLRRMLEVLGKGDILALVEAQRPLHPDLVEGQEDHAAPDARPGDLWGTGL